MYMTIATSDSWWVRWLKQFWGWVWGWLYNAIVSVAIWLIGILIDVIPEDWLPSVGWLLKYMEYANCWVALDFGLGLFNIYIAFVISFLVVKMILKLIPFGVG